MPYVFIYLMKSTMSLTGSTEVPICYYKNHVDNFLDPAAPFQWVPFEVDLAIDKVKEHHKAGIFSFRLYFHDETNDGRFDPKGILEWRTPVPKRMNT